MKINLKLRIRNNLRYEIKLLKIPRNNIDDELLLWHLDYLEKVEYDEEVDKRLFLDNLYLFYALLLKNEYIKLFKGLDLYNEINYSFLEDPEISNIKKISILIIKQSLKNNT